MRYARLVFYVLILLILFTFGFQNFDSLTIGVPIRFNLMGIVRLEPTPLEIWQIFLGTAFVVFAATLALDLATVLGLRAEIWKKDREIRNLRARVEEQEAEVKRLRANAAPTSPTSTAGAAAKPATTTAATPKPAETKPSQVATTKPAPDKDADTAPAGETEPSKA